MTTADKDAISADPVACEVFHADLAKITALKRVLIEPDAVSTLAETFKVLGDPTRVRLLDALSQTELCVCDLATLLGLSESAISHQLRLLRGMRLVCSRRAGRMVFYALDDRHILDLFRQGLHHVREESASGRAPLKAVAQLSVAGGVER